MWRFNSCRRPNNQSYKDYDCLTISVWNDNKRKLHNSIFTSSISGNRENFLFLILLMTLKLLSVHYRKRVDIFKGTRRWNQIKKLVKVPIISARLIPWPFSTHCVDTQHPFYHNEEHWKLGLVSLTNLFKSIWWE